MEVFPAGKDWGGLKIGHTETPDQGFQVLVPMRKRIKMRPSEDMGPYVVQGRGTCWEAERRLLKSHSVLRAN